MREEQQPLTAFAPGRVNLIGDHTDHTGGLVLPLALQLGTTVTGRGGGDRVHLRSATEPQPASVPLAVDDPAAFDPPWARYVAGVVAEMAPSVGFEGEVTTTLPVGAGLSSSAALEVSLALALGAHGDLVELARRCQRAEQRATGVPCGIMDQLASLAGREGHALRIDCTTLEVTPVPIPAALEVVVVHSGEARALVSSAYGERRRQCEDAATELGSLRTASVADLGALADPVLRRRARHVVTENARVDAMVAALHAVDGPAAGAILAEGQHSLRDDLEVSTPAVDALVERLTATPGVFGARLTGAGFGGCVVALSEPGALEEGRVARPSTGARLLGAAGAPGISHWADHGG